MDNRNPLTSDKDPGTELIVQANDTPNSFIDAYVDEDGVVRVQKNGARFVADNYSIVREK